ncbi:hypothetical protein ACFL1D_04570 [Candidatus Omnitrophota bacterium]
MNIVAICPNLSVKVSSFAEVPVYWGEKGHRVIVITCQQMDALKGKWIFPEQEMLGNTSFYRPYKNLTELYHRQGIHYFSIKRMLIDFKPHIVFCSGRGNIKLSRMIKKEFNIPSVFLTEYARDPFMLLSFKGKKYLQALNTGFLFKSYIGYYWRNLCRVFDAIMVSYHGDREYLDKLSYHGTEIHYAPWCNQIPELKKENRERGMGIHIGGLFPFKNAQELIKTIPLILENTPTERFIVIGPGPIAKGIVRLKQRYTRHIEYIESLPRQEAISFLAKSFYAYTPVIKAGLGFIGDSWGVKTPLIATHDVGRFLRNREDTLISQNVKSIDKVINELYNSEELYNTLVNNGYQRYLRDHTKEAVGENYLRVFSSVIGKK